MRGGGDEQNALLAAPMSAPNFMRAGKTEGARILTAFRDAHCMRGTLDCFVYFGISRTAAEIPGEGLLDLLAGWGTVLFEQRMSGHQNTGCTKAALCGAASLESILQWMQLPGSGQTFHRRDGPAFRIPHRCYAREYGNAIQQHCAGSAVALVTALLRSGQTERVPKRLQQREVRRYAHALSVSIYGQLGNRVHDSHLGSIRRS